MSAAMKIINIERNSKCRRNEEMAKYQSENENKINGERRKCHRHQW
jgi:hypothetical protein